MTLAVVAPGARADEGRVRLDPFARRSAAGGAALTKLLRQAGVNWVTGPTSGGLRAALDAAGIELRRSPAAAAANWVALEPLS